MNTQNMNYVAICDCGAVRASVRIDRRNLKAIGKTVTNWIRSGYLVQAETDEYVCKHFGKCRCKEIEAQQMSLFDDEAVQHGT